MKNQGESHSQSNLSCIDSPYNDVVHKLFESQVERTPDSVATVCEERVLTYRELNNEANILADILIKNYGVVKGDLVCLLLDRSEYTLIAILAVLKAGGVYVPIGVNSPEERVRYILDDCQTKLILTTSALLGQFSKLIGREERLNLVAIDNAGEKVSPEINGVKNPEVEVTSSDLLYVIYTSGTTGHPKGVMIEHAGIVNRIKWMNEKFPLEHTDKILQKTSYAFDVSVWELFWAHWYGACIVFAKPGGHKDAEYIQRLITREYITIVHFVPSMLTAFTDILHSSTSEDSQGSLSSLRIMFCSGEPLTVSQVQALKSRLPHTKIHNLYGPTEASIDVTHFDCNAENIKTVYIGKPISNMRCYILDSGGAQLPPGATGELHVSGVGVARGYLNNPRLTQEKFIANPFQTAEDKKRSQYAKIYKTGDLVRLTKENEIEYKGRNDFQIKLRGYRIELGEIESCIALFEGIKQVVVVALMLNTRKTLVCYYSSNSLIEQEDLEKYLLSKLPEYMIPTSFMKLECFPVTENGKLNRAALPIPDQSQSLVKEVSKDKVESIIKAAWAEVFDLPIERISRDADFFRLGGDSIVSIQLVSKLRRELMLTIQMKDIFTYKTIASFYDFAIGAKEKSQQQELTAEIGVLSGEVALLPIQSWFFNNKYKAPNYYNQSFSLRTEMLDMTRLREGLQQLVVHHDALRLRYKKVKGRYEQYYTPSCELPDIRSADVRLLGREGSDIFADKLQNILRKWQSEFDLENGPTFSLDYLYGFSDGSARLHMAVHHLLIDSVSWRVIAADLQACYHSKELPQKATSYRQWVRAIAIYADKHEGERDYWLDVLSDYDDEPLARLTRSNQSLNRGKLSLTENETTRFLKDCNRTYNTEINDLLLTALSYALQDVIGEKINHIVLEGHGREEIEASLDVTRTVGWFTTLFPVKLTCYSNLSDTIKKTKENLRQIPSKGIGYGALHGYVLEDLPKISFNYLGQFGTTLKENSPQDLWQIVDFDESLGVSIDLNNRDENSININGQVIDGRLQFDISSKLSLEKTEKLAQHFNQYLLDIVKHTVGQKRSFLTCHDVNYIITQPTLDLLQRDQEITSVYLANNLQQGFIYHAVNQGDIDDSYHVQFLWHYNIDIQVDTLQQAWRLAQEKYSCLRLRFSWDEENIIQIIDKKSNFEWNFIDLSSALAPELQLAEIEHLQAIDRRRGFSLNEGSLFRVTVIKRADTHFVCLFSHHHAILDGWGNDALQKYIHSTYLALIENKPVSNSIDNIYEMAQKYLQETQDCNQEYWDARISEIDKSQNLSGLLSLDAKRKGLDVSSHKRTLDSRDCSLTIEKDLLKRLKTLCNEEAVTLNSILLYVWHSILKLYGNAEQTVVGTTVSGRNIPIDTIEKSVGFYINTVPFIVDHTKIQGKSVIDLIREIQEHSNEVCHRSNVSLAKLQKGGRRLFENIFEYEKFASEDSSEDYKAKLKLSFEQSIETQDYPLGVVIYEDEDKLVFRLKYAGELFSSDVIEQVLLNVEYLLTTIVDTPCCNEQKKRILSDTAFDQNNQDELKLNTQNEMTISRLFENQVMETPDNIAVKCESRTLTYRQLDEKSNQVARHLSELGVVEETMVVLAVDRSIETIIGVLAILKAGGAYVPVDPHCPSEYYEHILAETKANIILTDEITQDTMPSSFSLVIALDDASLFEPYSPLPLASSHHSENLVYVIYTSGSTGYPKGVMVEHRSILNLIHDLTARYKFNPNDPSEVVLNFASICFDASVEQMLLALLNGGTLLLVPDKLWLDKDLFINYLSQNAVTHLHATPTYLEQLDLSAVKTLKRVISGGEKFTKKLGENVAYSKNLTVINEYGPTETSITALVKNVDDKHVSLGVPVSNMRCYIVDEYQRILPVGAIGELHLTGLGLARGYLNNSTLTEEKFVENPFQTETERLAGINTRLYKTGDLACMTESGEVEFYGRNDCQVKIRGYRIELGAIEAAVESYAGVQNNIALVAGDDNNKILVSYCLTEDELDSVRMKDYLRAKLPEYMIPSIFVCLSEFPLKISGKIDIDKLPPPNFSDETTHLAPKSPCEIKIGKALGEVLGIPDTEISITSDFFSLGGDSISAIRLLSKLRNEFNTEVTITDIFERRTIQNLSSLLEATTKQAPRISKSLVKHTAQTLSFAQARMWFIENYEKGTDAYNIPLVFRMKNNVNTSILESSIVSVIERQEILRTVIHSTDEGDLYQKVLDTDRVELKFPEVEVSSREMLDKNLKEHARTVFDLSREIPINFRLYIVINDSSPNEYYLSIVVHHIAFDGWSSPVMLRDINAYYKYHMARASSRSACVGLPNLSINYIDFSLWQKNYVKGDRLSEQLAYWVDKLDDYEKLNLLTDNKRPALADYSGGNITVELDGALSEGLRALAKYEKVSLYSVMLSGYFLLLKTYSRQEDIVIGTQVSGRHYPDVENIVGLFVNSLALRVKVKEDGSLAEHLKRVSNAVLEAQSHQDIPFENLVEVMGGEKDVSMHPIFQHVFGYQTFQMDDGETILEAYNSKNISYDFAKHDLSIYINDQAAVLTATFNYSTALFDEETIKGFINTYLVIMNQIHLTPNKCIGELNYLNDEDRDRLLSNSFSVGCSDMQVKPENSRVTVTRAVSPPAEKAYVLNEKLRLLPVGAVGELYLSGENMGGEQLIRYPFQSDNEQLCKTGDLVRWLPTGELEYLGGIDHQVKLHGYTINLKLIETVLSEFGNVDSTVLMLQDVDRERHLVSYYVATSPVDPQLLRQTLADKLPHQMVPSIYVQLQNLPQLPDGNVDMLALPVPKSSDESTMLRPQNKMESKLCGLWAVLLDIPEENISITNSFFSLGGSSMSAIRLALNITTLFECDFGVLEVFQHNTIRDMAAALELCISAQLNELEHNEEWVF